MRLLLINYEYPPLGGGAATATREIAAAMVRQGHQPIVLTTRFGHQPARSHEAGIEVVRVPSHRAQAHRSSIPEMLSFVRHATPVARTLLQNDSIDGVIAFFSIPGGWVAWRSRPSTTVPNPAPVVVALRGGDVPGTEPGLQLVHRLLTPLRRRILRHALAITANSPGLAAISRQADPFPVHVILNGVDHSYFCPPSEFRKRDAEPFRWLFVGRLQAQKNVAWLLNRFERLAQTDPPPRPFSFDIIGDGPNADALRQRAAASPKLAPLVRWHGWVDRSALLTHYQRAHALVNPSLYEGMPNVVAEAMACGLPALVSDIAGHHSLVQPGQSGERFDLTEPADFEAKARAWMRDPSSAARLGAQARAFVVENLSWDATSAAYVNLFLSRPSSKC